jgi:hypothetical protein
MMKSSISKTLGLILLLSSTAFAEGDPLFRIEEKGKWGFINKDGKVIIAPQYDDSYYSFSEGLAAVKVGRKWGYIDSENRMIIPPTFEGANQFRDGIAKVHLGSFTVDEGKGAFIDKSGKFVLGPWDRWTSQDFGEGLLQDKAGEKWGYLDRNGEVKIRHKFDDTNNFSEGLAGVQVDDSTAGFIDSNEKWVIRLDNAIPHYSGFSEGLAAVRDKKTGKVGYIDKSGEWKISPQFSDAREFKQDRAAVQVETKDDTGWPVRLWGVIDREGKIVASAKYRTVWSYEEGFANAVHEDKWGFLDLDGNLAIPCQFDVAEPFENGLAYVRVGGYDEATDWIGYINVRGEFIWRPSDFKERDEARAKALQKKQIEEEKIKKSPTIVVLTDPDSKEKGLLISWPKKIPFKGENAGKLPIRVSNLLDEEVFLEVTETESLSYSLDYWSGGFAGGGGSFTIFPDNTNLLKRLHATSYSKGKRFTCGCCGARINATLDANALQGGRARGTVTVMISGFYRNSGKRFYESVELPIELVEKVDDQEDAIKPAVTPELKEMKK